MVSELISNLGISLGLLIFLLVLSIFILIIWIYTLIHQYKKRRFGFFWATLLLTLLAGLGIIMIIIYWIYNSIKK